MSELAKMWSLCRALNDLEWAVHAWREHYREARRPTDDTKRRREVQRALGWNVLRLAPIPDAGDLDA